MLPYFLLRAVERDELQRARTDRIAAAKVGGDEALDARLRDGVGETDLEVAVRAGKANDDGVLAAERLDKFIFREAVGGLPNMSGAEKLDCA